jgi:L-fucose isomerase
MGMYTAVSNTEQWMEKFGVDVEEIDQWELVRRSEGVDGSNVRAAREWLERHAAGVHYDGDQLTPEILERPDPVLLRDERAHSGVEPWTSPVSKASRS